MTNKQWMKFASLLVNYLGMVIIGCAYLIRNEKGADKAFNEVERIKNQIEKMIDEQQ
jgi:hypothetical protein